jgi:uncharacterized damage-inducible protein DinB
MDLLDRLLGHDAWTTRLLLRRCQELSNEQLDQRFNIGHGTVRRTLHHIVFNVEVWAGLMAGEQVRLDLAPGSIPELMQRFQLASLQLSRVCRAVAERGAWDERWIDVLDTPPAEKSYGSGIAHIITHSMHHRAQLLFILKQLGISELPEGDVFSWEDRSGKPAR